MKRTLILAVGILFFAASSCEKETLNTGDVYQDDNLRIEFVNDNDSRCPLNTECIWAGQAEVFLKAISGEESVSFSLNGLGSDTVLFGYNIEFVDLLPYPESGVEVSFEGKELILNVTQL